MASKKKLLQAAAGSAGGAGLDVDEVFSTYLYKGTGTGSNLTVTNNIDLSTEGGLVWVKNRDSSAAHALFDTVRGQNILESQSTGGQDAFSAYGGSASASYNTNGFGINGTGASNLNSSGVDYASWTFRKAPKFFDVVTYTGNGNASQTISHSLGTTVGMLIIKRTSGSGAWNVYHRGTGNNKSLELNTSNAAYNNVPWGSVTSSSFEARSDILGNVNGATYVAYLFAHNSSDGGFGPDADQDIIKCGSYTGNGSTTGPSINLGFEPQLVMVKSATSSSAWTVVDDMRGMTVDGTVDPILYWNFNYSEDTDGRFTPQPTGFQVRSRGSTVNTSGETYIYMAIRRGPLAEPESASDVFTSVLGDGSGTPSIKTNNHVTDFGIAINKTGGGSVVGTRLLGTQQLQTHTSNAESTNSFFNWDFMNGWHTWTGLNTNYINWNWKRAPGYFDVVAYSGTGSARNLSHNLGVVPEMMWLKERSGTFDWNVYHKDLGGADKYLKLNGSDEVATATNRFNNTHPTASVFSLGTSSALNDSGATHIAYLFATLAGISKVGSYTGTGNNIDIDCGFSSGARFVLIKRTDASVGGSWWVVDTVRGLTSNNDPIIRLDTTDAQYTQFNPLTPLSSGFTVASTATDDFNASGGEYIFYAIA